MAACVGNDATALEPLGDGGSSGGSDAAPRDGGSSGEGSAVVPEGSTGLDAADSGDAAPSFKRIFITTGATTGDLGGLTGADAKCMEAAKAAKLDGNFVAWLSGAGQNAIDRIVGNGPWYDVRGVDLLFTGKTSGANPLTGLGPATPITRNESGQAFSPNVDIWTDTSYGGKPPSADYCQGDDTCDCTGWTSGSNTDHGFYAQSGQAGQNWTGSANIACTDVAHLICIESP
jgi:hypothetical protein